MEHPHENLRTLGAGEVPTLAETRCAVFHDASATVWFASDLGVFGWHLPTRARVAHHADIDAQALCVHGDEIVAATARGTVRWSAAHGAVTSREGSATRIRGVQAICARTGRRVVGGRPAKVLREDGALTRLDDANGALSFAFSPDGAAVLAWRESGDLSVYDVATGSRRWQLRDPGRPLRGAGWSGDDVVVVGRGDAIERLAAANGSPLGAATQVPGMHTLVVSPDGVACALGSLRDVCMLPDGAHTERPPLHDLPSRWKVLGPGGRLLATCGPAVFELATGRRVLGPSEHGGRVTALSWGRDGTALDTASATGGTIRGWRGEDGATAVRRDLDAAATSISLDRNGAVALVVDAQRLRLVDLATGATIAAREGAVAVAALTGNAHEVLLASGGDLEPAALALWSPTRGERWRTTLPERAATPPSRFVAPSALHAGADGGCAVAFTTGVVVVDLATGTPLRRIAVGTPTNIGRDHGLEHPFVDVVGACVLADRSSVVVGGEARVAAGYHERVVGVLVRCAAAGDPVRWSLRVAKPLCLAHASQRDRVAVSTPSEVMVVSADDGAVLGTWTPPACATALAFSPDGTQLAVGDVEGGVHVWRPPPTA